MNLVVERTNIGSFNEGLGWCLNGTLYVDMVRFCMTGEPCDSDGSGVLPEGSYPVVLSYSHDDEKVSPEVVTDKGNSSCRILGRINGGIGSIGVGRSKDLSALIPCEDTVNRIVGIMQRAEDVGEAVYVEFRNK